MVPYAVTCVCIIIGIIIRNIIESGNTDAVLENIRIWVIASLYGSGGPIDHQPSFVVKQIGAIWFLPALFFHWLLLSI